MKRLNHATSRNRIAAILLPLSMTLVGCGGPPQLGDDREAFRAVDALYTAVGLRDPRMIDGCGATLRGLRDAGKLSAAADDALVAIIVEAKGQSWEPALEHLSAFMEGQRR